MGILFLIMFHVPSFKQICAFALIQGNPALIEKQLKGAGSGNSLKDSPFVRALQDASMYVVVRNSNTDLYSRIWCICGKSSPSLRSTYSAYFTPHLYCSPLRCPSNDIELMYAKNIGLTADKTFITGPDVFQHLKTSCLDAKAFDPRDKECILRVLLLEHNREEIDSLVMEYRTFGSPEDALEESGENLYWSKKKLLMAGAFICCAILVIAIIVGVSQNSNSNIRGSIAPGTSAPTLASSSPTSIDITFTTAESPNAAPATAFPTSVAPTPMPITPRPSPYPTRAHTVFCRGQPAPINTDNNSRQSFDCGLGLPPVRFLWRTTGTDSLGFSDDEYFINAYQDISGSFVRVYRSPDQIEDMVGSSGISGAIGTGEESRFRAEFDCNIENVFLNCEGGTFEFAFVSCGCPDGFLMIEPCVATTLEEARDSVCVSP